MHVLGTMSKKLKKKFINQINTLFEQQMKWLQWCPKTYFIYCNIGNTHTGIPKKASIQST